MDFTWFWMIWRSLFFHPYAYDHQISIIHTVDHSVCGGDGEYVLISMYVSVHAGTPSTQHPVGEGLANSHSRQALSRKQRSAMFGVDRS